MDHGNYTDKQVRPVHIDCQNVTISVYPSITKPVTLDQRLPEKQAVHSFDGSPRFFAKNGFPIHIDKPNNTYNFANLRAAQRLALRKMGPRATIC